MGFVAVIGAGALGGATTHALARRERVREVRLIDPEGTIARGKALDLSQSAPVENFCTRITSAEVIEAAAGADAIVIADAAASNTEHAGEAGLALLRRIVAIADRSPLVCAGAQQRDLLARAVTELRVPTSRVIGTAPMALESALRAIAGLAMDGSGPEVALRVVGVPPRSAVVAWEEATVSGQPLTTEIPPHVVAGLNARIPGLWPPGPYSLGAACARVVEALVNGTRRRFTCFVALDAGPVRAAVSAMPIEIAHGAVRRVLQPALTRQERTMLENALEK
jgi:malate/lactate dehydrogenase